MIVTFRSPAFAVAFLFRATVASAHTGDVSGAGFLRGFEHPITGWNHVAAMVAVGLWGVLLGAPAIWLLPVTFPLVIAIGGALGVAGVPIPGVETGIALSAVVIGASVLLALRPPIWIAAAIVGVYAILHGYAHGQEMPLAASPIAFAAGFVIATGLLHLCGIAIGLLTRTPAGATAVRGLGAVIVLAGGLLPHRRAVRRFALAAALALAPAAASAHAAFGDLGPFYASFLHPLADPAQGMLVVAAAVLLARQPVATARLAYAGLVLCGALAVAVHAVAPPPAAPGLRVTGIAIALLGALALSGIRLGFAAVAFVAGAAIAAGLAIDLPPGLRPGALASFGGAAGIALLALFVWGGVDLAARRLNPLAGAVAASWTVAIGIMAAALPS